MKPSEEGINKAMAVLGLLRVCQAQTQWDERRIITEVIKTAYNTDLAPLVAENEKLKKQVAEVTRERTFYKAAWDAADALLPKADDIEFSSLSSRIEGLRYSLEKQLAEWDAELRELLQLLKLIRENYPEITKFRYDTLGFDMDSIFAKHKPRMENQLEPKHVCGLAGYDPMKNEPCPACKSPMEGK